ncbi:MAG: MATE family efflux transporter [Candidatus Buchananbacteria bacterium]|nr:MATE family efflux transporter [Candidatus Buchananbacteria bacterium]
MKSKASKSLEGPIFQSLITLAIPIVLANILQTAYQLTDAFWVGRLGGAAVAAVSVSFPVVFLLISLGAGFAIAGSTLVAQYFGAQNHKMVNHVAAQTLLMVAFSSVVLGVIGYLIAPGILRLMNVEPVVFVSALGFMRVSFLGIVFIFGFAMFQSVMRGIGEVTMPMYIVLATVLLNFVLDPLFIFGWGSVPGYGVMGAAMATFGTQALAAAVGFMLLLTGKYGIHLKLSDFKPDYKFIKKAFFLGFPSSIEQSARALGLMVMTFLIASFGTLTMAAYGVGANILQLVIIPGMGLSMAISVLVGQNIGAGNIRRASDIARFGSVFAFASLTIIGLVAFIFARQLITFFVPGDEMVIQTGTAFVRIMALSFGFMGVHLALMGVFRASGNMLATMIISLVSQWVLQFPAAYLFSKHTSLGVSGLWWSFPVSNVLIAFITVAWYAKGDWKKKKLTTEDRLVEKVSEEIIIEEGIR